MPSKKEKLLFNLKSAFDSFDSMEDAYYDFMPIAENLVKEFNTLLNPSELIPDILTFIENKPELEYGLGAPGTIGHFMESFYGKGYEEELIRSLERKPITYTLHLLHRVLRSEKEDRYFSILKGIVEKQNHEKEIIYEAVSMLKEFK